MNTNTLFTTVRYFTQFDPYHYSIDNRPLTDLAANDAVIATSVDAAVNSSTVGYYSLGHLVQGIYGTGNKFVASASFPGGLQLRIEPGFLALQRAISGTDSRLISKLALMTDAVTFNTISVSGLAAGQSRNYLVQAKYDTVTTGTPNLPTFDPANPRATDTIFSGICTVSIKAGTAATTGSQATPVPDAGYIGCLVVTIDDDSVTLSESNLSSYNSVWAEPGASIGATIVQATETTSGVAQIATVAEAQAQTDDTVFLTPNKLGQVTATTTRKGILELSTDAEALTGTDTTRGITAANLKYTLDNRLASQTVKGLIEIATNAEAAAGSASDLAITPASLSYTLSTLGVTAPPAASETVAGITEYASDAEMAISTTNNRSVTPQKVHNLLASWDFSTGVPNATTSVFGKVQLATNSDISGNNATKVATAAGVLYAVTNLVPTASTSTAGISSFASNAETATGSISNKAVTPLGLSYGYLQKTGGTLTGALSGTTGTFSGAMTAASFNASSAAKYKDFIADTSYGLSTINALRPVGYVSKLTGKHEIGLIADEVVSVIPEVVGFKDNEVDNLDYSRLVSVLIKAVQELDGKLKAILGE